jgi:ribosomal protein S18 acetylase RimI-like enzyme
VGTRLFLAASHEMRRHLRGAGLWLAAAADNVLAIRFYDRLGFMVTELRPAVWRQRAGPVADALPMTF